MQKFFVKNNQINDNKVYINGTDVNHIKNVLRLSKEDEIQICNQDTSENYIASIGEYDKVKEEIICDIISVINSKVEPNINITLFQGLPKADKMELIIQKTTEIGIKNIVPVEMERCVVKLEGKDLNKKIDRWQKIAEVAAKQSKRDIIPKINNSIKFSNVSSLINDYDLFVVAYEDEKEKTLKKVLKENIDAKNIAFLVGPEGGIDKKEINLIKETNARIVTLGNRILRTETAPIVITGNIIYELENR